MPKLLAYCGLDCAECEAYVATQANDRAGLEATAKKWAAQFGGTGIDPEKCICDGCSSGKRTSTAHAATCAIRLCASGRGLATCADCRDYGCATLQQFFNFAPVMKVRLDALRGGSGK
jgi:hypothetical protein